MHHLFQHRLSLTEYLPEGHAIERCNVARHDELILQTFAVDDWDENRPYKPCRTQLFRFNKLGLLQSLNLERTPGGIPQGLSDGRFLLITPWEPDNDLNALVLDSNGQFEKGFRVGDAVADVQVAAGDAVWVSYYDQGALQNRAWGRWSGLTEFDLQGNIKWQYDGGILDCYSLNVGKTDVHACYYTDFPVLRVSLKDKRATHWRNEFRRGCRALAVWGDHALLAGGYSGEEALASLVRLEGDETSLVAEFSLGLPSIVPHLTGRGPLLHYVDHQIWWTLDIRELL